MGRQCVSWPRHARCQHLWWAAAGGSGGQLLVGWEMNSSRSKRAVSCPPPSLLSPCLPLLAAHNLGKEANYEEGFLDARLKTFYPMQGAGQAGKCTVADGQRLTATCPLPPQQKLNKLDIRLIILVFHGIL